MHKYPSLIKIRVLILLATIFVVGSVGTLSFLYARGYRLNPQTNRLSPSGLFVIKSDPDGAQVYIDGALKTATNANLSLPPGTYDISVRKDGYLTWNKRLTIKKEEVTEATAHLFRIAPSLSAVTFTGIEAILISPDFSKLSYTVPFTPNNKDLEGLWIMDTLNLPLGFSREPRRITDGDLKKASWVFSPDAREILLTIGNASFLLETGKFTPQTQRVNVTSQRMEILKDWEDKFSKRQGAQVKKLPIEMAEIITKKASNFAFSPDEKMVVYTASSSANIPENLIPELPGASTQREERNIKAGSTYVYDLVEDKNFLIDEAGIVISGSLHYLKDKEPVNWQAVISQTGRTLSWYPSSRHLIIAEEGKITILDYDGTNRQNIYSGVYLSPYAYPTLSLDRLLILTNLGAGSSPPNLYSLGIK